MDELIMENQNLVYYIGNKFFSGYTSKSDLFQAGMTGLIEASKSFNPNFGVKFSSYAYNFIYGEMSKLIWKDKNIKISKDTQKLYYQVNKARLLLLQKYMREPTISELALFLEMREKEVESILSIPTSTYSLDEPICDNGKTISLYDYIEDKTMNIDDYVALKNELEKLNDDERKIIEARYLKDMTQSETAEELGMSQVQVSRNEKKVLVKLRDRLTA